eukprot:2855772-Pleurochrysis_carterae.AAC.3
MEARLRIRMTGLASGLDLTWVRIITETWFRLGASLGLALHKRSCETTGISNAILASVKTSKRAATTSRTDRDQQISPRTISTRACALARGTARVSTRIGYVPVEHRARSVQEHGAQLV